MLSDAVPETVTLPFTVVPSAGLLIDTVGICVSVPLATVIVSLSQRWLPDESVARASSVWLPVVYEAALSEIDHAVVPVASWYGPESTRSSTFDTFTLSEAVPETTIVPLTVDPSTGLVIPIVGTVVSSAWPASGLALAYPTKLRATTAARAWRSNLLGIIRNSFIRSGGARVAPHAACERKRPPL